MKKRIVCLMLAALFALNIAACSKNEPADPGYSVVQKDYPDSVVEKQTVRQTENNTINNNNASSDRISFSATSISKFREAFNSTFETRDGFVYMGRDDNQYDEFLSTACGIDLTISVCDSNERAREIFEDYYSRYIDLVDSQGWEGSSKYSYDGNEGYVFVNGISYRTHYYYDGIYLKDNVVVKVHLNADATSQRNRIDSFLRKLGYPAPSDYLN